MSGSPSSPRMIWAVTWLSTRWSPLIPGNGLGLWDRGLTPKAMLGTQKMRTLMTPREIWKRAAWLSEAPGDTNDPCGESTHAINGTREDERERDQNERDDRLVGIKSSGSE